MSGRSSIFQGQTASSCAEELDEDALFSGRALHVAGALVMPGLDGDPTVAVLEDARARGLTTSLDTVWDATGRWERLVPSLPYLDLFVPSLAEGSAISGQPEPESVAAWLRERGVGTVALKLGADGCFVSSEEFEGFVAAPAIEAIDGTGSGDAFAAGLLYGALAGWPLERSAALANAAGALAASAVGAVEGVRGLEETLTLAGLASSSMNARLNRLFAADGRCFDVAVDHGFFGEGSFLAGIEDMARTVTTLVEAGPDAIQLSPGQAALLQSIPGPAKPALVLRTDVANIYGGSPPSRLFSQVVEASVERAVVLDAACVVVNLLLLPGQPDLHEQCVRNVSALRAACDRSDAADGRAAGDEAGRTRLRVDGDVEKIVPLVRQAVELGADVIKADPTDDLGGLSTRGPGCGHAPGARAWRRQRARRRDPAPHRGDHAAGRRGDRLRAQRGPARRSRSHDAGADGDRPRRVSEEGGKRLRSGG